LTLSLKRYSSLEYVNKIGAGIGIYDHRVINK